MITLNKRMTTTTNEQKKFKVRITTGASSCEAWLGHIIVKKKK